MSNQKNEKPEDPKPAPNADAKPADGAAEGSRFAAGADGKPLGKPRRQHLGIRNVRPRFHLELVAAFAHVLDDPLVARSAGVN